MMASQVNSDVQIQCLQMVVASTCFISGNSICGSSVSVNYNGKIITVPILDECASCEEGHIDLSISAFKALESNLDVGILQGLTYGQAPKTIIGALATEPSQLFSEANTEPIAAPTAIKRRVCKSKKCILLHVQVLVHKIKIC